MADDQKQSEGIGDQANPDWFREPSRREHVIGSALFIGFGVFFVLLFLFLHGWWFRWVILLLGIWSILTGALHALDACRRRSH
jgi:hypothetical protein